MRLDEPGGRGGALRYLSIALIAYGALGVAIHLRLLPLAAAGFMAWLGLPAASDMPALWGVLGLLQAHYDALPWLPWAAWLVGVGLLAFRSSPAPFAEWDDPPPTPPDPLRLRRLALAVLAVLLLIGGYARMAELWPQAYGLSQFPYDDEGVYAGASQLFVQGILPYRDYFFAHPPIAALSYAPAMLYHFTEWGSPTSFMMARYLSVGYSLVTLGLIFLIGWRLVGLLGGVIAGALWALDGRVVEINRKVMLDGPMVLLSCGALLLYLWVRPVLAGETTERPPRRPMLVLAVVGGVAALSALTKIAGAACLLAIAADLLWIHLDNRRVRTTLAPLVPQLGTLVIGALGAALVCVVPFLFVAPSEFVREVLFFQLLRPSDGLIDIPARIADLTATYANPLTPLFAALGFLTISTIIVRAHLSPVITHHVSPPTPWRAIALWTFFSLLLFTYSRSFYSHYYIQLAAPLCLLGAGASPLFDWARDLLRQSGSPMRLWVRLLPALALLLVAAPLVLVQWSGVTSRHEDRIFEIVSRYVNNAVNPGTPVLTTDEQFNFLAARPPSRNASGFLIDSYGHMIFLGLGLGTRDFGDLLGASLRGQHGNDAYAVMQSAAPQADFLDRALSVPLIVIHQKGLARLTDATVAAIEARSRVEERQARYTIYRVVR